MGETLFVALTTNRRPTKDRRPLSGSARTEASRFTLKP